MSNDVFKEKNVWAVMDEQGIIHEGDEENMRIAFFVLTCDMMGMVEFEDNTNMNYSEQFEKYKCNWTGKLKLIEIHKIENNE